MDDEKQMEFDRAAKSRMTDFQRRVLGGLEQLVAERRIDTRVAERACRDDEMIGSTSADRYYVMTVPRGEWVVEVYVYRDEAGILGGMKWTPFEKEDYPVEQALIDALMRAVSSAIDCPQRA